MRPASPDDASRFAVLYSQHRDRVYAYAVSKAGRQLADDILSEVFIVAWRRFGAVPDPPLPWLLAVARNIAMSKTRAAARERSLASQMGTWLSEAEMTVTDIADGVADRVAILTALARLPERDRDLLMLVAWTTCRRRRPRGSSAARQRRSSCGPATAGMLVISPDGQIRVFSPGPAYTPVWLTSVSYPLGS